MAFCALRYTIMTNAADARAMISSLDRSPLHAANLLLDLPTWCGDIQKMFVRHLLRASLSTLLHVSLPENEMLEMLYRLGVAVLAASGKAAAGMITCYEMR